ncbi:MAG: PaaI family thioesterase [Candidatus Dormibacteraeota bacterium]|nr:PaaI family thioesterase [Candidatus Dormibacteraeota bacterium]
MTQPSQATHLAEPPPLLDLAAAQAIVDGSAFGPWWGFRVEAIAHGRARLRLPFQSHFLRPGEVLQGGCCMTLADVGFWIALLAVGGKNDPAMTLEMKTNFLGAARGDLVCDARVIRAGRQVVFGDAETRGEAGQLVAHHTVTYLRPFGIAEAPE